MSIDPRIIRRAKAIRERWARESAGRPHYRPCPGAFLNGGALSYALPLSTALEMATTFVRAEDMDLSVTWEEESEPWDGDCPAPKHVLCGLVYDPENPRRCLASLGGVGVDSLDDTYLQEEESNLLREAIDEIDARNDRAATVAANELASRATYAGNASP